MSPELSVHDPKADPAAMLRRRRRRLFWSLVTILVLLPTMLWDARLVGLRLAAVRSAGPASAEAEGSPAPPSRVRQLPVAAPPLYHALGDAAPPRSADIAPVGPGVEPLADSSPVAAPEAPVILLTGGPGGPFDPLRDEPGVLPQITPLGPGTGPVVYPGQPPADPPTSPPVVGPVLPLDPDDGDPAPPVITVDPFDPPDPVDPPVDPVRPLNPDRPIVTPDLPLAPTSGPVPEPSAWAMTILGLGLLGAALRWRAQYGRQMG